ncbi:MAG: adenylosuccinate lyase [Rhodobacteraceae bacterium]|nr:adenylosuccinate lyase [Paracoccaceae bacterium]
MKTKVILTSAALTLASALSAYAGCGKHSEQAMSCAEGTSWDAETLTCVPQTTS